MNTNKSSKWLCVIMMCKIQRFFNWKYHIKCIDRWIKYIYHIYMNPHFFLFSLLFAQKLLFYTPFPTFHNHSIEVGSTYNVRFSYCCVIMPPPPLTWTSSIEITSSVFAAKIKMKQAHFPDNFHLVKGKIK